MSGACRGGRRSLPLEDGDGLAKDVPLGPVGGLADRLPQREPPHLLHLVVVLGDVTPRGPHQVEPHRLADPLALPLVEVRDRAEIPVDLGLEPGLLTDLPEGRVLGRLLVLDEPLRQAPGELAAARPPRGQRDVDGAIGAPKDNAPGRALRPSPHDRDPPPPPRSSREPLELRAPGELLEWAELLREPGELRESRDSAPLLGVEDERAILATFAPVAGTRSAPRSLRIAVASPPAKYRTCWSARALSATTRNPGGRPAGGMASARYSVSWEARAGLTSPISCARTEARTRSGSGSHSAETMAATGPRSVSKTTTLPTIWGGRSRTAAIRSADRSRPRTGSSSCLMSRPTR